MSCSPPPCKMQRRNSDEAAEALQRLDSPEQETIAAQIARERVKFPAEVCGSVRRALARVLANEDEYDVDDCTIPAIMRFVAEADTVTTATAVMQGVLRDHPQLDAAEIVRIVYAMTEGDTTKTLVVLRNTKTLTHAQFVECIHAHMDRTFKSPCAFAVMMLLDVTEQTYAPDACAMLALLDPKEQKYECALGRLARLVCGGTRPMMPIESFSCFDGFFGEPVAVARMWAATRDMADADTRRTVRKELRMHLWHEQRAQQHNIRRLREQLAVAEKWEQTVQELDSSDDE